MQSCQLYFRKMSLDKKFFVFIFRLDQNILLQEQKAILISYLSNASSESNGSAK